jgi:hypothetical protein
LQIIFSNTLMPGREYLPPLIDGSVRLPAAATPESAVEFIVSYQQAQIEQELADPHCREDVKQIGLQAKTILEHLGPTLTYPEISALAFSVIEIQGDGTPKVIPGAGVKRQPQAQELLDGVMERINQLGVFSPYAIAKAFDFSLAPSPTSFKHLGRKN